MKLLCAILALSLSTVCGNTLADMQENAKQEHISETSKRTGIERASDVFTMNQYMDKVILDTVTFIKELQIDPIKLHGHIMDFHAFDPSGTYKTGVLSLANKYVYGISSIARNGDVEITYLPDYEISVKTLFLVNNWKIKELLNFKLDSVYYSGGILINQGASNFSVSFNMYTDSKEIDLKSITLGYSASPMYYIDYDPPLSAEPWLMKGLEDKLTFDLYGIPAGRMMQILKAVFMDTISVNAAP